MGGNARRRRQETLRDTNKSGEEILDEKLARIQYQSAHVAIQWWNGMSNLSLFIILYAIYHIYSDVTKYIEQMDPSINWTFWNVFDIVSHIAVHIVTIINAFFIKKYLKSHSRDKNALYYSFFMSLLEILFIFHAFPMGAFYLFATMCIQNFMEYQHTDIKKSIANIKSPKLE